MTIVLKLQTHSYALYIRTTSFYRELSQKESCFIKVARVLHVLIENSNKFLKTGAA